MRDTNILDMLDGKRHRNDDIFKIVEEELKKRGFLKSVLQIRTKWKALKLQYYKAKRANSISGNDRRESPFWDELEELLGHRPACNVGGIDTSCILDRNETYEGDVDTVEAVTNIADDEVAMELEPEPIAGSSQQREPERELGPVRKKRKVDRKGGYNEALKTFSKELKESQKEVANLFLQKHAEIMARELEEQRQWEQKLLKEDRVATERMMTNLMSSFFFNLRQTYQQSSQFPFINPSQAPIPNSVPIPFPSPLSPTNIRFPSTQAASNPTYVPRPYEPCFFPSQASSTPSSASMSYPSPSSQTENNSTIFPSRGVR